MTTSVVQGGLTAGTAGNGTVSRALATNATAGNELVAIVFGNGAGSTTLTVSDNNTNTWAYVDATKIVTNGSFLVAIRIALAENIHAGATTVTGTNTANGTDVPVIVLLEVSGTPTSGSIDGTLHSTNSGTSTTPNTVAFTPTAGDLLIGAFVDLTGLASETITGNGSWTNTVGGNSLISTNGSTSYAGGVQFIANAPASSSQNSWTLGDSQGWAAAVVALKAASGSTAFNRSSSWSLAPTVTVARSLTLGRAASWSLTPTVTVGRLYGAVRGLSWSVTPVVTVARSQAVGRALSWTVAPVVTVARLVTLGRSLSWSQVPSTVVSNGLAGLASAWRMLLGVGR